MTTGCEDGRQLRTALRVGRLGRGGPARGSSRGHPRERFTIGPWALCPVGAATALHGAASPSLWFLPTQEQTLRTETATVSSLLYTQTSTHQPRDHWTRTISLIMSIKKKTKNRQKHLQLLLCPTRVGRMRKRGFTGKSTYKSLHMDWRDERLSHAGMTSRA